MGLDVVGIKPFYEVRHNFSLFKGQLNNGSNHRIAQLFNCVKGVSMEFLLKERLRELRKEKYETQVQVAADIGIKEQQYQTYERGVNLPNLENTWKLADHFGVSVDYLIGRSEER
ncbi:MAG: helix-turn-helix transcriptional regulator [Oscillibacter sp.]|jgi:DNA-binding XRE family transcriptional regulator|nr:helix-turn-helix transcriptional regulator [Oscillibacter sp.]